MRMILRIKEMLILKLSCSKWQVQKLLNAGCTEWYLLSCFLHILRSGCVNPCSGFVYRDRVFVAMVPVAKISLGPSVSCAAGSW